MKIFDNKKALVISPHTDDVEFGMGATLARLVESGCKIDWLVLSNAYKSLPKGYADNVLLTEQKASADFYRIENPLMDELFPVRDFPAHRQEILELLVSLKQNSYDLVFCPSSFDCHQDHATVAQEVKRCFRSSTILGYELPWNNYSECFNFYSVLDDAHIEKKIHAISLYKSQNYKNYASAELIRATAITAGARVNVDLAERFEIVRMVD